MKIILDALSNFQSSLGTTVLQTVKPRPLQFTQIRIITDHQVLRGRGWGGWGILPKENRTRGAIRKKKRESALISTIQVLSLTLKKLFKLFPPKNIILTQLKVQKKKFMPQNIALSLPTRLQLLAQSHVHDVRDSLICVTIPRNLRNNRGC